MKADLVRPSNWEAPISGCAEFIITIPYSDSHMEVPVCADFAFDYEPSDNDNEKEIWNIEFTEATSEPDGAQSRLTLKDGGSQAYIGARRVTTEPTAEYPLRPEYENLYVQFFDLLQSNASKGKHDDAPSVVDCTTTALLKEIMRKGNYKVGGPFYF